MSNLAEHIRAQFKWRKVQAPKTWRPADVGEEVVGYYGGQTLKEGRYGQYSVALVHVPLGESVMLSGTKVIQLIDSSLIKPGHPIRIIWMGMKDLPNGHTMKDFEVHVAEGEAVPFEALPLPETPPTLTVVPPAALKATPTQKRDLNRVWSRLRRYYREENEEYLVEEFLESNLVVLRGMEIIPDPDLFGTTRRQPLVLTPALVKELSS